MLYTESSVGHLATVASLELFTVLGAGKRNGPKTVGCVFSASSFVRRLRCRPRIAEKYRSGPPVLDLRILSAFDHHLLVRP